MPCVAIGARKIMLNRVRVTNNVPLGSGETAGFIVKSTTSAGVELKRPEFSLSEADGRRFLSLEGWVLKTVAYTVTNKEVGKTFGFNHATGFKITLPPAASVPAGKVRFAIATAASSGNHSVDVVAADTIKGADAAGAGGDQFDLTGYELGDTIEFESDGVSRWYISNRQTAALVAADLASSSVTTAKIADGAVSAPKLAVQGAAVTSTADGTGTGAIAAPTTFRTFIAVTSAAAGNQVALPAISAGTLGQEIWLTVGANGYELITIAASNNTINQVDSDGTNQLDVAANTTVRATQVSATAWLAEQIAATTITVVAPDND
jgi:hypothetical protein